MGLGTRVSRGVSLGLLGLQPHRQRPIRVAGQGHLHLGPVVARCGMASWDGRETRTASATFWVAGIVESKARRVDGNSVGCLSG